MAWNSGFYQFAESIRELSNGAINYKALYALVGTKGRYINHESAAVRRRTAANLSRLMHSCRYADDMRERYLDESDVFRAAAEDLTERLRTSVNRAVPSLLEALLTTVWTGMRGGLANERDAGRPDVNLDRLDSEHANLAAWARATARVGGDPIQDVLTMYFYILAFGSLDERFSRALVAPTPGFPDDAMPAAAPAADRAPAPAPEPRAASTQASAPDHSWGYLAKLVGDDLHAISAIWTVSPSKPFTLGRYADCDAIDRYPYISRLHCRIYLLDGRWYVEDAASLHGTRVLAREDDGSWHTVFDSQETEHGSLVHELAFGDVIELAGASRYLFGSFMPEPAVVSAPARALIG